MPIAVVGMSFRGPGEASDLDGLWKMAAEKREAWSPVPKDRWNHEAFYHPDSNRSGTTNVNGGHFLQHDLSKFDAPFFSMTRAEAEALDPQQRLLLECSYEALENAGIPLGEVAGSETCCFVGSFCGDYTDMLSRDPDSMPFYQATSSGHSRAIIANRLSYFFNLRGPSATIDTACSSSLVALHLACQSLRTGESKQALVAGANVILSHEMTISMTMMRFLSPDGRCYSFDDRANGYARGEGVGCVFLKPLKDAIRDGDPIRAIIRNTGSNQDGKTPGITLPSREAQEELIRSVYEKANIDPAVTSFVECHGTGTAAGDPLETAAIANVFTSKRPPGKTLRIGSVKANIGHLEGASGIAGLVKTVLMLERGKILPNRNFDRPSKRIPFAEWKLKVPTEVEDFGVSGPCIASVNSFGYGGANAHAIVQDTGSFLESMAVPRSRSGSPHVNGNGHLCSRINGDSDRTHLNGNSGTNGVNGAQRIRDSESPERIFLLSATDSKAIQSQAESLARFLRDDTSVDEGSLLQDLAYTLSERRTRFPIKAAIHAASKEDLISALSQNKLNGTRSTKNGALGFVFTGQGAQWWGMGRQLFASFPVFAESIAAAEAKMTSLGADWILRDEMHKDAENTRLNEAGLSQPVCTALQIALVDLLNSWGIKPAAVTGHSSGEIAAAYCAGALTADDAIAAAYHRGLISELVKERCPVRGGMMAVGMSEAGAAPLIANLKNGKVTIACVNSPNSLTLSGDATGIDELKGTLDERNIFARKLAVEVAYHSYHMSYVAKDYLAAISHIKPVKPKSAGECIFYSSVTGQQASSDDLGPQYWVDNMLGQVKFESSLREMCQSTITIRSTTKKRSSTKYTISALCEIGPHSALAGPIRQILTANDRLRDKAIAVLSCLVRNQDAESTVADAVCRLSELGLPADIASFNAVTPLPTMRKPRVLSNLPPYRWNHDSSYWAESRVSKEYRLRPYRRNDILGVPVAHFNPSEPRWRNIVKAIETPWVKDHKVQGSIVYPAAGFMCMALEAMVSQARERSIDVASFELREVTIGQALVVPDDTGEVELILSLRPLSASVRSPSELWNEFCISSISPDQRWTEHSRGLARIIKASKPNVVSTPSQLDAERSGITEFVKRISASATDPISPEHFYTQLCKLGLDYGPTFANVESIQHGAHTAVASIKIAETAPVMPNAFEYQHTLHPCTLDGLFHPLFAALKIGSTELQEPFVPVLVNRLVLSADMRTAQGDRLDTWTEATTLDNRQISASTVVFDKAVSSEQPVLQIDGLVCMKIARDEGDTGRPEKTHYGYQTSWLADVDEISSTDFASLCQDLVPDAQEEERIEALEEAGYFLMKRAFPQLSDSDIEKAQPHHKRLYNCIKLRLEEHRGKYAANDAAVDELLEVVSSSGAEGRLLVQVGRNLTPIIQGNRDALELMLEDGTLDAYYRDNSRFDRNYRQAMRYVDLAGHKNPNMSILEIGSGTGGATLPILQALTDNDTGLCRFGKFTFTDISTGFFEAAKVKLAQWSNLLTYAKLDIESDPTEQGFEVGEYDMILAANVLHATRSMENTLSNVRKLLKPGGKLVLVELTRERFTTSTIFGTLPGWFAGEEADRVRGPTLTEEKWEVLLHKTGFNGLDVAASDARSEVHHQGSMMAATASHEMSLTESKPAEQMKKADFLIIHDGQAPDSPYVEQLYQWAQSLGASVSVSSLENCVPDDKICVVLSELSGFVFRSPSGLLFEKIKAVFTTAAALLWVTKGASISPTDPTANMATGFARTVRSEYGNNTVALLDLDPTGTTSAGVKAIQALITHHLLGHQPPGSPVAAENEYVERSGKLLIPRFVPNKTLDRSMNSILNQTAFDMVPFEQQDRQLVVEVGTPGLLDTIRFVDDPRVETELPAGAVEVQVKAAGVNFKDVMMAMGQIAVETLGGECSGVIHKVGADVHNLRVGDRVSCYGFGTFSNRVRQDAVAVQRIPDDMSFELAAALPVTFCTAFYSVVHVARVQSGQSVLIHAASGGLGQALIELCKMREAEIFCTVGTLEKKQLLTDNYGIPEDHILTSRDASFAPALMRMTGGKGVDVIMNSVAGEMLRVTWDCIAPFGTFVELGARDYTINTRLEMYKFARNVTFTAVNLVSLIRERPEVAAQVWADVMDLFRKKELRGPTPLTPYSISQLEPAMRLMQGGKHIGKLVLTHSDGDLVKASPPNSLSKALFKPSATYLLVGGMGGLGRAIALWMLARGARNFIFASRSGLDRPEAQDLKSKLEESGANVIVCKCNISNKADLVDLMKQASVLPPIKGIIQGAMVLRDSLLSNMQISEYEAVVKPKVDGTWNLHHQFEEDNLDFFVMLSSTSGLIGNASQAAYAASSTFLDSFALYRRARGLPAATIDLGVITDAGYVAANKDLARALERQGFEGTTSEQLMALLHSAILAARPSSPSSSHIDELARGHIVTGLGTWREGAVAAFDRPIFSHFRRAGQSADADDAGAGTEDAGANAMRVRGPLKSASNLTEAARIVCDGLVAKISSLSMIPVEDISTDRPLSEYGMDSLVAVEMRNWIAREMDASVPILELMANEPLRTLASKVLAKSRLVDGKQP
ncbi:putative polyketide synthase [Xylariaceae sp. FL0662B]|nr:putative polyketide synthase [Xylariaceae sp. FL0662B]